MTAVAWAALGLALVAALAAVGLWRRAAEERARSAETRQRLEERLSLAEVRRHEMQRRAETAFSELAALRLAAGLDGPRAVPSSQLTELVRTASLSTACLADAEGLPHAGVGGIDDVDTLAAFAGALASVLPRGATLLARDERGTELAARALDVGGARRVVVAEGLGAFPRHAFGRTVLRLDPNPPDAAPLPEATLLADPSVASLLTGGVGAAMRLPGGGGVSENPLCAALLTRHGSTLEAARAWLTAHRVLEPSSVQITDAHGTAALLVAGPAAAVVATRSEGLDVLTEQRLAGLVRRRLNPRKAA